MLTSAVLAAVLAAPAADATCSWDRPGHNPYTGDMAAAVDRYGDMPAPVRERLKERMARHDYDDVVTIRRDSIEGNGRYDPTIRDMHFGSRSVCHGVTRAAWAPEATEQGLVYCEGSECVLVPAVCRNVSRITRAAPPAAPPTAAGAPPEEMLYPAPGAGTTPTFETAAAPPGDTGIGLAPSPGGGGLGPPIYVPPFSPIPGGFIPIPTSPVPEPATWALWLMGSAALVAWRRRRVVTAHRKATTS